MLKIRQTAALIAIAPVIVRSKLMSPDKFQDWFFKS